MTKQDAEFERHVSDQIVREVGKLLGYTRIRFYENQQERTAAPYITRLYGQRLVIPYQGWELNLTVTLWNGKVKADLGRGVWDGGVYENQTDEYEFDAADPTFIDEIVKKCREAIVRGPEQELVPERQPQEEQREPVPDSPAGVP